MNFVQFIKSTCGLAVFVKMTDLIRSQTQNCRRFRVRIVFEKLSYDQAITAQAAATATMVTTFMSFCAAQYLINVTPFTNRYYHYYHHHCQ